MSDQLANERASTGQVGGQAVMLIPHRAPGVEEVTLPPDHQRILAAVRRAAGPVMARQVGEVLDSGMVGMGSSCLVAVERVAAGSTRKIHFC